MLTFLIMPTCSARTVIQINFYCVPNVTLCEINYMNRLLRLLRVWMWNGVKKVYEQLCPSSMILGLILFGQNVLQLQSQSAEKKHTS